MVRSFRETHWLTSRLNIVRLRDSQALGISNLSLTR